MGALYAKFTISGHWLYDLDALTAALRRGWIIQEQAFGPLDSHGVAQLLALLRTRGVAFLGAAGPKVTEAVDALGRGCAAVSALMERRGYSAGGSRRTDRDQDQLPLFSQRDRCFYQVRAKMRVRCCYCSHRGQRSLRVSIPLVFAGSVQWKSWLFVCRMCHVSSAATLTLSSE